MKTPISNFVFCLSLLLISSFVVKSSFARCNSICQKGKEHKSNCEKWCQANKANGCVKCSTHIGCGMGLTSMKSWTGLGDNWFACKETKYAANSNEMKEKAEEWCREYLKAMPQSKCYIGKSGSVCPTGYKTVKEEKITWGRNWKVCLKEGDQEIKDCSSSAYIQIRKAIDFITKFYDNNSGNFRFEKGDWNDGRAKDKLARKIATVKIDCDSNRSNKCEGGKYGWAFPGMGKKVVICYSNHKDFCELVDTIFHELAHKAGIDTSSGHNDGDNDDLVYKTAGKAYKACIKNGHQHNL